MAKDKIPAENEQNDSGANNSKIGKSAFMVNGELFDTVPTPMYGQRLGSSVSISRDDRYKVSVRAPGFMRLNYIPTVGSVTSNTDPLNLATQVLYKKVQDAMKNRNLPYQKIDVFINLLASDSIRLAYNDIARMYSGLITRDKWSEYGGPELVRALGYDYNSCMAARPEIRSHLIMWKSILDKYPLPKVFNFTSLHEQLGREIYVDTISNKAQKYVFVPAALYTYEGVDTGRELRYREWHSSTSNAGETWGTMRDRMNALISAMINSTNFDIISAAIISTFPDTPTVDVAVPGESDELTYAADPAALNAIMNTVMVDMTTAQINEHLAIYDNGLNFIEIPAFKINTERDAVAAWIPDAINLLKDCPTSAEMVNYMRWAPSGRGILDGTDDMDAQLYAKLFEHWGSEIILNAKVYTTYDQSTTVEDPNGTRTHQSGTFTFDNGGLSGGELNSSQLAVIAAFRSHPIVYVGGVPFTEWNYIAEVPDKEPYFTALLWKAFVETFG